jgi:hypothetical protein
MFRKGRTKAAIREIRDDDANRTPPPSGRRLRVMIEPSPLLGEMVARGRLSARPGFADRSEVPVHAARDAFSPLSPWGASSCGMPFAPSRWALSTRTCT